MNFLHGLLTRMRTWRRRYQPLLQNRWLRLGLQIFILLFCAVYLIKSLQGIEKPEALLSGNYGLALAALVGTIGSTFLGALNWWLVLLALGQAVPWRTAARIHFQSTLAKYLPGYFWQLLGKAYMTRQAGSSLRNVGLALMVEMGIIYATGVAMMGLLLVAIPFVTRWLVKRLGAAGQPVAVDLRLLAASEVLVVVNWVLIGWYFWMLGNAITPVSIDQLNNFIFVLTTSFLIGFLVLVVPGSIGVREAIIVLLLGPALTNPLAVVIALLDRAVFILSEVLSYLIFRAGEHFWKR
jgi:hypothetical protein